jgi:DNA-binding transcriptional MerR regulator
MKTAEPLWTIDELTFAVGDALRVRYDGAPSGRVRDVPDQRTIRYYTTLGLIDRPAEMRGRTALYGRRHLLQLVAIKKLQARGQSLTEVQQALAGQTDTVLAQVAALDIGAQLGNAGRASSRSAAGTCERRQRPSLKLDRSTAREPARSSARAFWREAPVPSPAESQRSAQARLDSVPDRACTVPDGAPSVVDDLQTSPGAEMAVAGDPPNQFRPTNLPLAVTLHGIPLSDGVTLLLASSRPLEGQDLEAIRAAAASLIATLNRRQLIPARQEGEPP